ncbi:hypothetical protein CAEBREN_16967 [Caenorhabditis brenneri]|uniref:F-box domain-containing protein n=1 Tax=Caenorhabditis brenneri TaxID=135651 RepID=G0NQT9_CAEBE|nr:hypothetical protein CAEBREN_16967 [Caenorhabditis brenneri]
MSSSATTSPVSLLDIPELPLKLICSYVGFKSLQSLRLVSKPLCHFIDTQKPSVEIDDFTIRINHDSMQLKLTSCGLNSHLLAHVLEKEMLVCSGGRIRGSENKDYLNYAFNAVKFVLNTQTTHTFKRLEYSDEFNPEFSKMFEKFLTDQNIILRVCEFSFEGNEHQALRFLPFLDSNILKRFNFCGGSESISSDDLTKLEHWKKAKHLSINNKVFCVSIQNFSHFETAGFCMHTITAQDLIYLREKYSQSPDFSSAIISYRILEPAAAQVFGEPSWKDKWVFRCYDPNFALIIDFAYQHIRFHRTHISSTTLSVIE